MLFNLRVFNERLRRLTYMVDDRALVTRNERAIVRLSITSGIMMLAGGSAMGVVLVSHSIRFRFVGVVVLMVILNINGFAATKRAHAYRTGWVEARNGMIASLAEAFRRGMSGEEWAEAEQARTLAVYGVSVAGSESVESSEG